MKTATKVSKKAARAAVKKSDKEKKVAAVSASKRVTTACVIYELLDATHGEAKFEQATEAIKQGKGDAGGFSPKCLAWYKNKWRALNDVKIERKSKPERKDAAKKEGEKVTKKASSKKAKATAAA